MLMQMAQAGRGSLPLPPGHGADTGLVARSGDHARANVGGQGQAAGGNGAATMSPNALLLAVISASNQAAARRAIAGQGPGQATQVNQLVQQISAGTPLLTETTVSALPLPPPPSSRAGGLLGGLLATLRALRPPSAEQIGETFRSAASTMQEIARPTIQMLAAPLQGFRTLIDLGRLGRRRGSSRNGDDRSGRGISGGGPLDGDADDGDVQHYTGTPRNWTLIIVPTIMMLLILATVTYGVAITIDALAGG